MKDSTIGSWKTFKLARALVLAALWLGGLPGAQAQQRVSLVVGFPPGGGVDMAARLVAEKLTPILGTTVIVENRPGASSGIAARHVANSKPDGRTIFITSNSVLINQLTNADANYDMERDFIALGKYYSQPTLIGARKGFPATKLEDVIALSKKQDITYGSPGLGSIPHLAAEQLLSLLAGGKFRHIPYPGASQALSDAMGNHVDLVSVTAPAAVSFVKADKLNGIVVTSAARMTTLPDVPTAAESGYPGFAVDTWVGFFIPSGTDKGIADKLEQAIANVSNDPEVVQKLLAQGYDKINVRGAAFQKDMADEIRSWKGLLEKVPLK